MKFFCFVTSLFLSSNLFAGYLVCQHPRGEESKIIVSRHYIQNKNIGIFLTWEDKKIKISTSENDMIFFDDSENKTWSTIKNVTAHHDGYDYVLQVQEPGRFKNATFQLIDQATGAIAHSALGLSCEAEDFSE